MWQSELKTGAWSSQVADRCTFSSTDRKVARARRRHPLLSQGIRVSLRSEYCSSRCQRSATEPAAASIMQTWNQVAHTLKVRSLRVLRFKKPTVAYRTNGTARFPRTWDHPQRPRDLNSRFGTVVDHRIWCPLNSIDDTTDHLATYGSPVFTLGQFSDTLWQDSSTQL